MILDFNVVGVNTMEFDHENTRYLKFRQDIIDRILSLSKEKGLSLTALCKKSHVGYSTLSKFIKDPNKTIYLDTIDKLCSGLEISFYDFWKPITFSDSKK